MLDNLALLKHSVHTDICLITYHLLSSSCFHKRHGYGRWQAIVDDKDLRIQEVICQELNLPFINLPVPGQAASQSQNGTNTANAVAPGSQLKENGGGNDIATDVAPGTADASNQARLHQDPSILLYFRDMQRRQVEFIKKRVLLLEKGLNAEYQKEYFVSLITFFTHLHIGLLCVFCRSLKEISLKYYCLGKS